MSLRTAMAHRNLLYLLSLKELRTRYKKSVLGWAWSLFNPLSQMLIFSVIFIWFGVWAAILSFGVGKWIPTLGAWARIGLLAFFTFSVVIYAIKHGVHAPPAHQFKPTYTLFIALVPVLFFNSSRSILR